MKKEIFFGLQLITALIITATPVLVAAASVQLSWQGNSEPDHQGYNLYYGTESRVYGPPIGIDKSTTFVVAGLADSTVYYFAISAFDNSGNESGYSSEVPIKTASSQGGTLADTVAPSIQITSPNTADVFETNQGALTIAGQASDDRNLSTITWSSSSGANGVVSGTTSWSVGDITLMPGKNIITVAASDAAGNQNNDTITVYYDADVNLVSAVSAASGLKYEIQDNLSDGNRVYIDRSYAYGNLPGQLQGSTYIVTANDDKVSNGDRFLSFQVNRPVTVYVAHDDRIISKPVWMDQFTDTGLDLTSDVPMSLFARSFASGSVVLGGNGGDGDTSMYTVAIGD